MNLDINKIITFYENQYNDLYRKYIILILEKEAIEKDLEGTRASNAELIKSIERYRELKDE